jgi:glycosyltransferase involved in cell wall biosynthesis
MAPLHSNPSFAPDEPLISVVIPTLNEEAVIGRCLQSLSKNDLPKSAFEVIVVDNGSVDKTIAIAKSFERDLALSALSVKQAYISALRNRGAAEARGKFLAFLDADCLAPETWLSTALRRLERNDGGIMGAHYQIPDDATWVGRLWTLDRFAEKAGKVSYVPAGDLLIDRQTFSSIGGFNESIQTNEDFELCERVRAKGLPVMAYRDLSVTHLGTPRTLQAFYRKQRWHGMHVFRVFMADPDKKKNRRPVLLASYAAACIVGLTIGVLVGLANVMWSVFVAFAALLVFPLLGLAALRTFRRRRFWHVIPLTVLYLTFSIARAHSLLYNVRPNL